jgi:putative transposase
MQELSGMSEAARNVAMARYRVIQPYLEQKRSLAMVTDDADVCFRTAQRWVSLYRKLGLVALARKSRDDRCARRVVSPKIKAAIEGLALERPPLPIRSICRQIRQFAEATGERLPRYGTVYDLVREVPGSLLTLPHHGSKAYSEGFDLVHRREAARANAIWQADHAQLNILLLREDGQLARPWLTIVIDDFLCPAVSAELAGEAIPLRDIVRVRNQRRRELSSILHDRQQIVDCYSQGDP